MKKKAADISETVSKKGRPSRFSKEERTIHEWTKPEVKTARGKLNLGYRISAIRIIMDAKNPKLNWLYDEKAAKAGSGEMQQTILTELGKLESDPNALLAIAKRLCELKPKTREAVAIIRRFRLGEREPNCLQLTNEIIHTLNDYRKRFPKLTKKQMLTVLTNVEYQITQK